MLGNMVAVANGKGGVYKTSATANLGALAAVSGWRTLVVDTDPQGHLALDLGATDRTDHGKGLMSAMMTGEGLYLVDEVRDGLDLIPGGEGAAGLAGQLAVRLQTEDPVEVLMSFQEAIAPIADNYDLILVDTPPGETQTLRSVFAASRWIIIPTMVDSGSRSGIDRTARVILGVRSANPDLSILGAVITGLSRGSTRMAANARQQLEQDLEGIAPVLGSIIHNVELAASTCREKGILAHEYEQATGPGVSTGRRGLADDYDDLINELLRAITRGDR
jgi:cellulose biosynthesis protein BcsQ